MYWIANLVLMFATPDLPRITINNLEGGYRVEVAPFGLSLSNAVDAEVERQAAERCAEKEVKWGAFSSNASIPKNRDPSGSKVSGYVRNFSCAEPRLRTAAKVPDDWQPNDGDQADVRRVFSNYYARRDAGDFEAAFAMFDPEARPAASPALAEANRKRGQGSRRITGVTWYVNPASAPLPGAYAALDFTGDYTGVHVYCGYIVLYRQNSGSYRIVREEQNVLEKGTESVDPAMITEMRAAACRGN